MSTTWTPTAVASKATTQNFRLWRAVEDQRHASTLALVDTLEEQTLLEMLLNESKPSIPKDAQTLDDLLYTPFRYPPLPMGSRFRAPTDPGVFYGAHEKRTACAEHGFWQWRFLNDAPTLIEIAPKERTLFQAAVRARSVDLRTRPFVRDRKDWSQTSIYRATQAFASIAREAHVEALHYESVRDRQKGVCTAILTPRAFSREKPLTQETWWLSVKPTHVLWKPQLSTQQGFEFTFSS